MEGSRSQKKTSGKSIRSQDMHGITLLAGELTPWLGNNLFSPYPPRRASGPKSVRAKAWHGALGGPFFDHFFASILDSILDSSWVRFGLVLGSFWHAFGSPNRVKLDTKSVLKRYFFKNVDFHADLRFPMKNHQNRPQDGPKIASRPVQDGSKSDKKVMHLSS